MNQLQGSHLHDTKCYRVKVCSYHELCSSAVFTVMHTQHELESHTHKAVDCASTNCLDNMIENLN